MAFVAPIVSGFASSISGASICRSRSVSHSRSNVVTMKVSQAMPFMEVPPALEDDNIPGNVGFDPLNLSSVFNFKFLQEAEIKHCRVAMLGALGYIFPEIWTVPGVPFMTPTQAHNVMVEIGSMSQILLWVSFLEVFGLVALLETIYGDRAPGDFKFDPLGLAKNPETMAKYKLSELKNGRLAMCAFGGLYHSGLVTHQRVLDQLTHLQPMQIPNGVY